MAQVESVARALCKANGSDPDGYTRVGFMGLFGPALVNWTGYVSQAKAAIKSMECQ